MPAIAMKGESFSEKLCLAFGYFLPGELEEGRSGHEMAIALVAASSLGAEVEYRSAITRRREAEIHRHQLD